MTRLAAQAAAQVPGRPRWVGELGALLIYLPARLDEPEIGLLAELGRDLPIVTGLAWCDDPLAERLTEDSARTLAERLGTSVVTLDEPVEAASVSLVSAPDPDQEVRAVVRRVAADLEAGIPLWRMTVLCTAEDAYSGPVREALDAAGLPWHGALGRPAAEGWAAWSLLGLLGLCERRFAREAVLECLANRPPQPSGGQEQPLPDVPGWLYLAIILDTYSRKVVGWAMTDHLRTELATAALQTALETRWPNPDLVHHTDRGAQGEFNRSSQHHAGKELRWHYHKRGRSDRAGRPPM